MARVLVWGGGGHGKVVADLVRVTGHTLVGFVDAREELLGQVVEPGGAAVTLLQDELLEMCETDRLSTFADWVVVAIGDNAVRERVTQKLPESYRAPALIHPRACLSQDVTVGSGAVVFAGVLINAAARIGEGVILNTGCIIEHDCHVSDWVHVSPGAVLCGTVSVGVSTWVGANSVTIQTRKIGARAIVGAGSVVIHDVPDEVLVVGNPARTVRSLTSP